MGEEDGRRSFLHTTAATRAEGEFFRRFIYRSVLFPLLLLLFFFFVLSRKKNSRQETFIREIISVSMGIGGRIFLQRGRKEKNLSRTVHMERV